MRRGRKRTRRNEKAKQLRPDSIVLDLSMPVMNGLDAARVLKRLMPKVPLIMYSAFGDGYVEQQASLLGISAVVSKSEPATTAVGSARTPADSDSRIAALSLDIKLKPRNQFL
jgi:CheY-like chemotaxis protein